ncbi:MAG TPA: HPP family protein [Ktedonobacterales bacterium]|nr:HPP family protein [Ktedonobacterales bacterium]
MNDTVTEQTPAVVGVDHREDKRRRRFCALWALLLLPMFLGLVAIVGSATHLRFLLFPPLAAIGFALFLEPYHRRTSLRSVVFGPVMGASIGVVALSWIPAGPLRIVTVTALGIAALYLLQAELTPALAVALLTLLVGASGVAYIISIALSSLTLWVFFLLWRSVVFTRFYPPTDTVSQGDSWAHLRSLL